MSTQPPSIWIYLERCRAQAMLRHCLLHHFTLTNEVHFDGSSFLAMLQLRILYFTVLFSLSCVSCQSLVLYSSFDSGHTFVAKRIKLVTVDTHAMRKAVREVASRLYLPVLQYIIATV